MERHENDQYVQSRPTKLQRDAAFAQADSIMARQRWFNRIGRKGYMLEDPSNRMWLRFVVESSKAQ